MSVYVCPDTGKYPCPDHTACPIYNFTTVLESREISYGKEDDLAKEMSDTYYKQSFEKIDQP